MSTVTNVVSTQNESPVKSAPLFCGKLEWHHISEGIGTAGKDESGVPQWWDGDLVLVIVETNRGRDIAVVRISCDEHYFHAYEQNDNDEFGWMPDQWEWWAKLDKSNFPSPQNAGGERT